MTALLDGRAVDAVRAELAALYAARGNRAAIAVMAQLARRPR